MGLELREGSAARTQIGDDLIEALVKWNSRGGGDTEAVIETAIADAPLNLNASPGEQA